MSLNALRRARSPELNASRKASNCRNGVPARADSAWVAVILGAGICAIPNAADKTMDTVSFRIGPASILGGFLGRFHNQDVHHSLSWLQLQAELLLQRCAERRWSRLIRGCAYFW